jgi:hypothetical protein
VRLPNSLIEALISIILQNGMQNSLNKVRKHQNSLNEALALRSNIIGTHSSFSEAGSCQKSLKLSVNCNFNEKRKIIPEMKCEIHILE